MFGLLALICRERAANVNLVGREAAVLVPTNEATTARRPGGRIDALTLTGWSMWACHVCLLHQVRLAGRMQIADQRACWSDRSGCVSASLPVRGLSSRAHLVRQRDWTPPSRSPGGGLAIANCARKPPRRDGNTNVRVDWSHLIHHAAYAAMTPVITSARLGTQRK